LHLTPERVDAAVESSRDLGKSVAMTWHSMGGYVDKVFDHTWLGKISSHGQHLLSGTALTVAGGIGYGAAGIEGVAGAAKIIQGFREKSGVKKLDGFLDLTAGAAIYSTIAGVGTVPLLLGPVAAGLGVARGMVHAARAYQGADPEKEVQGFLDSTRSATVMCVLLGNALPWMATAAAVIGPMATTVQACRGYVNVRDGLHKADKGQQVEGLADVGTAVGLGLAFCGLAVPGIAVMCASQGGRLLYKAVPPLHRAIDHGLDVARLPLKLAVGSIELTLDPLFQKVRHWIDTHSPWVHGKATVT
jgi:hypothetical protein